ncbi:MAG: phosphoglucomutase/phosphomannomutase family protein [Dehalococcoidales bacterium]
MKRTGIRFGTSGWRAILADEFTLDNVKLVTAAIARYVLTTEGATRGVVVGRDTRFMGESFCRTMAQVLAGQGVKTYLCDAPVPTPVLSFEILRRAAAGGLNVTASHNPPEYNGIKFSPGWGGPAMPSTTRKIEKLISELGRGDDIQELSLAEANRAGLCQLTSPRQAYLESLADKIDIPALAKGGLRVIVDHMHGTSSSYLDRFLKRAGVSLKRLHINSDPYFGHGRPDPAEENLARLISSLRRDPSLDLGLATDGDADRFGVVDKGGVYLEANLVSALLVDYLARTRGLKGTVARSVASTHLLDAVAQSHGLRVLETPVGFKYIGQLLARGKIVAGCEESAGFSMKGHVPEKDGILTCVLIAEMVAREGRTLRQLRDRLFKRVGALFTRRRDISIGAQAKKGLRRRLISPPLRIGGKKLKDVVRLDGTKLVLEDNCWILFRESGTEPLVRIYGEARSERELNLLMEQGAELVMGAGC